MLEFVAAIFFLIITPGPGVLSTAGVGASYGRKAGIAYVTGLFLGNNLVILMVVSGLAALVLAVPWIRFVLMCVSTAYLLYLAAKIAFSGSKLAFIHPENAPGVWQGLALQPINPKAYAVNTALFSGFAFSGMGLGAETVIKLLLVNAIWVPIHLLWLWLGLSIERLDLSRRSQSIVNGVMALSMVIVVALAVLAQF